ncbi:hypothetical protein CHK_0355 [Christensenella hongkongensis]|uniref:Uncharacterized protein n=1 Tax=Christensenella hongkongensis TaxID=270498 RepID=A0A0M2NPB6_9FIRM|nr:hypothetical protein CHK_0355 [Christensenella hongkongensis]
MTCPKYPATEIHFFGFIAHRPILKYCKCNKYIYYWGRKGYK